MRFSLPLAALLSVATAVTAQCPITGIAQQSYGAGCNPVFLNPPTIQAGFDPRSCTLTLRVQGFGGCCNTFLVNRLLAIGVRQANVPLPQFGSGCALLVDPIAVLIQPSRAGEEFRFPLPPGLQPGMFYAQGAFHYFTTIGFSNDLAFSDGLLVRLL